MSGRTATCIGLGNGVGWLATIPQTPEEDGVYRWNEVYYSYDDLPALFANL